MRHVIINNPEFLFILGSNIRRVDGVYLSSQFWRLWLNLKLASCCGIKNYCPLHSMEIGDMHGEVLETGFMGGWMAIHWFKM
jgi:hypothetical protein